MPRSTTLCAVVLALLAGAATAQAPAGTIAKNGLRLNVRSDFPVLAEGPLPAAKSIGNITTLVPPAASGTDRRVNVRALDSVQTFPGSRPFVHTSVAEGTVASFGPFLVALHGASGAEVVARENGALAVARNIGLAYSWSGDGGRSWDSAYLPPLPGANGSSGFGSIDVDRAGNFYAGGIGLSADGALTVSVNKSVDGGRRFGAALPVDAQGRVDKSWLAVGPDPRTPWRDNVYLTWIAFDDASGASTLRFARSTDGGRRFATSTVFTPELDSEPANPQNVVQFPMVATDKATGHIYIAFLQFGFVAQDYLRVLESADGGQTFHPVAFNAPGAPNPYVYPVIQPGTFSECGAARGALPDGQIVYVPNTLLTVHAGAELGGSASGLPRYAHATRVNLQPAIAVSKGNLHLAWTNSTSLEFGDPASGARIHYLRSRNNGASWSAAQTIDTAGAPSTRQIMPAIALGRSTFELGSVLLPAPSDVHISYSVQGEDGRLVRRLARSTNGGTSFPARDIRTLSGTPSTLAPSNVPLADPNNPYRTTNYNRLKGACVSLGDYAGMSVDAGTVHAVWGDSRETLRQPDDALDPISGQMHAREDVYYRAVPLR